MQVDSVKGCVVSYEKTKAQSVAVQCGIPNCHHQAHAVISALHSGGHGLSQAGNMGGTAPEKICRSKICSVFEPFQVEILI